MADNTVKITGEKRIAELLSQLHDRMTTGKKPLMNDIGETVLESIQENFQQQGRPKRWDSLSKKTTIPHRERTNRWPGNILNREGTSGLLGSIAQQPTDDSVAVGTNKIYATTMHYGAKKGAFGKTRRGAPIPWGDIPARPFMMLQSNDVDAIKQSILSFMTGGW